MTTPLQRGAMLAENIRLRDITLDDLRLAIEDGADLSAHDRLYGRTPLHFAAMHGFSDFVAALVDAGADPQAVCAKGMTPLMYAAAHDRMDVVAYLAACGVAVDTADDTGRTAVHHAAASGRGGIVAYLVDLSPDLLGRTDAEGKTPRDLAAAYIHGKNAVRDIDALRLCHDTDSALASKHAVRISTFKPRGR